MTLEERIKSALDLHPKDKKLRLLAQGYADAWKVCADDRSAANLTALEKWETRLSDLLDALADAPPPEQAPGWRWCEEAKAWPDPLPNSNRAYDYMEAMGWSVGRSTWMKKAKGEWAMPTAAGWPQERANEYARLCGTPREGTPASRWTPPEARPSKAERIGLDQGRQIQDLAAELKLVTIRGKEQDNEIRGYKIAIQKGELVPAEALYEKQLALALVMYERVKDVFAANVPAIIRAAGGDSGLHVPVAQALRDTLDKGMREATAHEAYQKLFHVMRNQDGIRH